MRELLVKPRTIKGKTKITNVTEGENNMIYKLTFLQNSLFDVSKMNLRGVADRARIL